MATRMHYLKIGLKAQTVTMKLFFSNY